MSEQVLKQIEETKGLRDQREQREQQQNNTCTTKDQILVKVKGQDNSVIQFKIKKTTPFKKLMNAYCGKQGVQLDSMRFKFDGLPIGPDDTPISIDIESDDVIEAYLPQTGGFNLRH